MSALYVLAIDDFRPIAEVASRNPTVTVVRRGPYFEVSSEVPFEIDRASTGCRNAIWYSAIAAVAEGSVATWDRAAIRIVPADNDGSGQQRVGE